MSSSKRKAAFLFLAPAVLAAADPNIVVLEEIVAKVNGDIITRSELVKGRAAVQEDLARRGLKGRELASAAEERARDILRDRIDQLLLIQKGKELNINVDPEITKQVADIQKAAGIADPEKFQAFVREQTGMLLEDYKNEMRNSLITQRVIRQEVGSKVNIPRAEVREYYEANKKEFFRPEDRVFLSEILISTQGKDAAGIAAAEKKARDLVARAKKGERFAELARDNSDSPSAENGGDIGGRKKDDLRTEVADAVWEQSRGFITDPPLKLENGFLILRVDDKQKAGQAEFEEVENLIMERLYMPRFQPKIREYLTALRQDAFLEIKEGYLDTAAAPGKNTAWSDPAQLRPETVTKEEVALKTRRKRLLWTLPIPGTKINRTGSSRS